MARLTRELSELVGSSATALKEAVKGGARMVTATFTTSADVVDEAGVSARNLAKVSSIYTGDAVRDAEYSVKVSGIKRDFKLKGVEKALEDPKIEAKVVKTMADSFIKELEEDALF